MLPYDFDDFWRETIAESQKLFKPFEVERDRLRSTGEVDVFKVFFNSWGDARIFSWYAKPLAEDGFPGLIVFPGYSSYSSVPREWAKEGFAVLAVSVRGHPWSDEGYRPGFPGFLTAGLDDKAHYGYRGVYVDCYRSVDFLLGRDEVDREKIYVTGKSQGGGLTLIAAALRHEIKAAAADVPFLCAIREAVKLTDFYPYAEIGDYIRMNPEKEEVFFATLDYFDVVNFADKISCPTLISVGLRDQICPPETAYALYAALRCEKEIREYPEAGHEGGGYAHDEFKLEWLKKIVRRT